jgi:serine/threonine protein kinase/Tfp pilus assembly protein PilF
MTPEKWKHVKAIFFDARDVPVDQRPEFLKRKCDDDQELRSEVEHLLDSYDENDSFLENSAVAEVAGIFNDERNSGDDFDSEMETARFQTGDLLNQRYEVIRLLGKGGMGAVYLAKDTRIDRNVSLKVLHSDVASNKERLRRFAQEARAVSALNHPHIMTIYEFDKTDGEIHFIVGEFVDGNTLSNYRIGENLNVSEVLDIAIQVASALSAAHEAGIIHRDIKPENIMVRRDGYIKVLDFGLAKLTRQTHPVGSGSEDPTRELNTTNPGSIMGTASYMSPEQARGIQVDARTDIWSLGVVIYEMLTGHRPFSGETPADILVTMLREEPLPLRSHIDDLPSELEWIVSKTLSKKLEGRYQTSKELRTDLEKIKKRIEYDEESKRSSTGSFRNDKDKDREEDRTAGDGSISTLGTVTKKTNGATNETNNVSIFWSSPSVENVLKQARSHRIGSVVVALILVILISSIFYYAFLASRSNEQIDSIAVLPFENLSTNKDLTYLSDGVSESLINQLSQLPQLKVISRNSSFKFRDENPDLPNIASKLGVRAVVTGSVAQIGDELMIKFEIVDAPENKHLLGGQYNRKASDLLEIQNEIAQSVSEQLHLKLTDFQSKRIANNGTEDSEAFRYYLSGLVELNGPQNVLGKALEYFQKAVELDPDFADAHTEIAWIYWNRANASGDPKQLMPKVKAETELALAKDPNLAKAHIMLATLKEYEFDWQAAEQEYRRAIELSPNLDFARNNYAFFLSIMGRQSEALAQLDQLRIRDPINMRQLLTTKGIILAWGRSFDDALKAFQEAQAIDQTVKVEDFSLGYVYGGKGLYSEAAAHFKKAVEIVGGDEDYSLALVFLAATYAKLPDKQAEAREILTRLEAMDTYVSPATLAIVYAALDENDKAMGALEKAYLERDLQLRFIGVGYEYDGLRSDPRFADLIKRIGLHQ